MERSVTHTRGQAAIATVVVVGLELAWLYALMHALARGLQLSIAVPPLLLVFAASFMLTLSMRAMDRSRRVITFVSWLVWPFVTIVALMVLLYSDAGLADGSLGAVMLHGLKGVLRDVAGALFIVPASGVLWALGGRLARIRMAYDIVVVEFQFGLMALAGAFFIGYLIGIDQPAAIPTAIVFVGLGLIGAAVTRVDEEGGLSFFRRNGTWWGMLSLSVTVVLLLGLLAGILFTPELMQLVGRGFRALWHLFDRLIDAIASLFPSSGAAEIEAPPAPEMPALPEEGQGVSFGLPQWLLRPSRIIYGVIVGGLGLFALWRIVSQLINWMRHRADRGKVVIESLPGAFRFDLARLFRRILSWFGGLSLFNRFRRDSREEPGPMTSMRRLYADMLRWGAESGIPRGSSQTPFEYQEMLCTVLPAYQTQVTSITEGYVRAKYGGQPPNEGELRRLREDRRGLKRRAARAVGVKKTNRLADETEGHGDVQRQAF